MKKFLFCFTLCLFFSVSVCRASEVSAKSALLYDCFCEKSLFEKAADAPLPMASTTKIMTCLLSCELYDPEQTVTVRPEWCNVEGSSMYLRPDESLKIKDLLCGLMLMSGNDAAVALASVKTGIVSDFVDLMNEKARSLGMDNTHFTNPSGLDDDLHYTTANDLCKLTSFALENPLFAQICALRQTQAAGRFMANHNKLLFTFEGAVGVKTGYTESAGRCLVSCVIRNGRKFIAVTLNDPDDWRDHETLYNNAFNEMTVKTLIKKGVVGKAYVAGRGTTPVYINENIKAYLTDEEYKQISIAIIAPRIVYGPVKSGDRFGELRVCSGGRLIVSSPVFFTENSDGFYSE